MIRKTLACASILVLAGCNAGPNKTNIELIQNMMDQVSVKSQDWNPKEGDKVQMRQPPPGTIPRGQAPYKYLNDPAGAEQDKNPFAGVTSAEVIELGRRNYDIYCAVCHGAGGAGDGPVAEKMAVKPRSLITPESIGFSDGRIHYAIVAGRGVMGSYAGQVHSEKARWAVVNYVRVLQKKAK